VHDPHDDARGGDDASFFVGRVLGIGRLDDGCLHRIDHAVEQRGPDRLPAGPAALAGIERAHDARHLLGKAQPNGNGMQQRRRGARIAAAGALARLDDEADVLCAKLQHRVERQRPP